MPSAIAIANKVLNDAERDSQEEVLKSFPQRLVFEATNRCNLRCAMCGQSHRDFKGVDLSLNHFCKTRSFWGTAHDISLFGWGEPLLNPHLMDFFDMLSLYGANLFILTNGLLVTKEMARRWVLGRLAYLNFSVDGVTPETYNAIRKGSDFSRVISNIEQVVTVKREMKSAKPYLRMVFVGMRRNIEELPAFVEMAAHLGMDEAKMVYMIAYGKEMESEILFHHKELTNDILAQAEGKARALGIRLTLPDRFSLDDTPPPPRKPCYRPWEEFFVQSDGKVRLCMLSHEVIGDLAAEKAEDIWNNERFRLFRKTVNGERPLNTCMRCPQYSEMDVNRIESFLQTDTVLPGEKNA